jgi:hypothetical protein
MATASNSDPAPNCRIYRCAVGAVAVIGVGAFVLRFLVRDLMQTIGYSPQTAWSFPGIIDTAVAVSTPCLLHSGTSLRTARVEVADLTPRTAHKRGGRGGISKWGSRPAGDDHRDGNGLGDFRAHRTLKHCGEASATMAADDDELSVRGLLDQPARWVVAD